MVAANRRPLLIVVAVVLACAVALFVFDYMSGTTHAPQAPPVAVVVAAKAIPARQEIDPSMLTVQTIPASAVQPGAFTSTAILNGDVALSDIPAGTMITAANAGPASALEQAVHLAKGMRAMSIPIDEVKGVSGLAQPGDRVDVYAVTPGVGTRRAEAYAILRDVRVLAVGGSTVGSAGSNDAQALATRSMTLEVSPQGAKTLELADLNATLRLALRPPKEPARSEPVDAFTLSPQVSVASAPSAPKSIEAPAAAPAAAPAPAAPHVAGYGQIEYIFGDKVESSGTP
jgi:pilus assembly protein CpaB